MDFDYAAARDRNFNHSMKRLRDRAERRREQLQKIDTSNAPAQTQRLIQELQVHQIELEMQYEELLMTQAETESLRARYTDLFDFAPVGYVAIDVLGIVQELNLHGAKLLGTTRHRLTNRRFLQFVVPVSRDTFLQFMIEVLATDEPCKLEIGLLRDDDSTLRVRLDGISLPDPKGTRLCRLAITDITAEHRAATDHQQSEARFQALLDHSPDGLLLLRGTYVLSANARAPALLGAADPTHLLGRHLVSFAPSTQPDGRSSRAVLDEHFAAALRTGHARFEWAGRHLDTGESVWHELTLTRLTSLPSDGSPLLLAACRDFTARHHADDALLRGQSA